MASYSIEKRTLASGESRYKATVTVKHRSKIAQRFSKTHKKKTLATAQDAVHKSALELERVLHSNWPSLNQG